MGVIKKRILLYDSNRFLYRYLNTAFFGKYEFVFFSDVVVDDFALKKYNAIVFIVEKPIDFFEFFKISNKGIPIIFGCFEKKFYLRREEVEATCNMNILDMTGTKMEVKDQIKEHLQVILARK